VRGALNEQLSRIQLKHVAELELMEEIKSFLKQRAQIERDYSQVSWKLLIIIIIIDYELFRVCRNWSANILVGMKPKHHQK
jgi:phage-related protein